MLDVKRKEEKGAENEALSANESTMQVLIAKSP